MASFLILLIVVLPVLIGFLFGIILWTTGGTKGQSEMSCGSCGYPVRGLKALNCPECGADLRAVGITRGSGKGSRTMGVWLTVLCGGLIVLGCLGSGLWMGVSQPSLQVTPSQQAMPAPVQPKTSSDAEDAPDGPGDDGTQELEAAPE